MAVVRQVMPSTGAMGLPIKMLLLIFGGLGVLAGAGCNRRLTTVFRSLRLDARLLAAEHSQAGDL